MLGKGIATDTLCTCLPSWASTSSAFPRYRSTMAFLTLITLMGS